MISSNINWFKVDEIQPEQGKEVLFYREDAGCFSGFRGCLAELMPEGVLNEFESSEGLTEDDLWEIEYWAFSVVGLERLELDLKPTLWANYPEL